MPLHKRNPAPLAGGDRALDLVHAAERDEIKDTLDPGPLQVAVLVSRHGLTPHRARLVARLAFGESEAA